MKKWIIYTLIIALNFCISCSDDIIDAGDTVSNGEPITLTLGIDVPEMGATGTRTFEDNLTEDKSLWLVVFDELGYLTEYVKATELKRNENGVTTFKVTLRSSSKPRIIHFLLNYTDDLNIEFGHESNVIGDLVVSNQQGVYWQRKIVEKLNNKETLEKEFQEIPLIRNFAKITLENTVDNFVLTGFALWQEANSGTVAPYYKGGFVDYTKAIGVDKPYEILSKDGYDGHIPDDVEYNHPQPKDIVWHKPEESAFLYEHSVVDNVKKELSLLIKGYLKDKGSTKDTYYRADLVIYDPNTGKVQNLNVLRNLDYHFVIKHVVSNGRPDVRSAIIGVANNNLSGSAVVRRLESISDGVSSLYVSYTDTVLVSTDPIKLKFKYVPNLSDKTTTYNKIVTFEWYDGKDGNIFDINNNLTYEENTVDGWATITLKPSCKMPAYPINQALNLYVKNERTTLNRQVRFELRPTIDMQVRCLTKEVKQEAGSPVVLNIYIPDRMNRAMFPLKFTIESQEMWNNSYVQQLISPARDEVISVEMGPSTIENLTGQNSFHYVRYLDYDEYLELQKTSDNTQRILQCNFITTRDHSSSNIYVDNVYFTRKSDYFLNNYFGFSFDNHFNSHTNYYGSDIPVRFNIETDYEENLTLSSENSSLSIESIEGDGATLNDNSLHMPHGGSYYIKCKTKDWNSLCSLTVTRQDGTKIELKGEQRNILYMTLKGNVNEPWSNSLSVNILRSKDGGSSFETLETKKWSDLTSGVEITNKDIGENDLIRFEYTIILFDKILYRSTEDKKASELANQTVTVNFKEI